MVTVVDPSGADAQRYFDGITWTTLTFFVTFIFVQLAFSAGAGGGAAAVRDVPGLDGRHRDDDRL